MYLCGIKGYSKPNVTRYCINIRVFFFINTDKYYRSDYYLQLYHHSWHYNLNWVLASTNFYLQTTICYCSRPVFRGSCILRNTILLSLLWSVSGCWPLSWSSLFFRISVIIHSDEYPTHSDFISLEILRWKSVCVCARKCI